MNPFERDIVVALDHNDFRAANNAFHRELSQDRYTRPEQIVAEVNRAEENRAHNFVQLQGNGQYLDIAPANYGDNRGYAPVPPPQQPYYEGQGQGGISPGAAGALGAIIGLGVGIAVGRHNDNHYYNRPRY